MAAMMTLRHNHPEKFMRLLAAGVEGIAAYLGG
jgi:hypothetical protein